MLVFWKSEPQYADTRYAYKKQYVKQSHHSNFVENAPKMIERLFVSH